MKNLMDFKLNRFLNSLLSLYNLQPQEYGWGKGCIAGSPLSRGWFAAGSLSGGWYSLVLVHYSEIVGSWFIVRRMVG